MDPATIGLAFAGAKAAVAGIKEVIKLGKDINEVSGQIVDYFQHKGVIEKAQLVKEREQREAAWDKKNGIRVKKTDAELTAEAMDIVLKKRLLEKQEYELYEMLVWTGNGDIWHEMVAVRNEMRKKILDEEAKELQQRIVNDKKSKERKELIQDLSLVIGAIVIIVGIFTAVVQWGISEGLWRPNNNKCVRADYHC
jgi:hypothetical protein